MNYSKMKLSTLFLLTLFFTNITYSKMASKEPINLLLPTNITNNGENSLKQIDAHLEKIQRVLQKTKKSDTIQYTSLYDDIAELLLSKNKRLMKMDKHATINTDKVCDFTLKYEEVEFIKTQYYKTPFHDEVAKTLQNIAALYEQCYRPMAEKFLQSVLKIKEKLYTQQSAEVAKAHDALANYYRLSMANFKNAIKHYEVAKGIREKLYTSNDPRITTNFNSLAMSLYYYGDKSNQAEKLLLHTITIREISPYNAKFPLYHAYLDAGVYYRIKQKFSKSIHYFKKAEKSFFETIDSDYIMILNELSTIYLNQNDSKNAIAYAKKAYEKAKILYDNQQDPRVLNLLRNYHELKGLK